jgi:serine/threonine protein kinase
VKLCDFGLSKKVSDISALNQTFCGSPDYLSPEVLKKKGYNYLRDVFALGVLAYELIHGVTPFLGGSINETYKKIIEEEVEFRDNISKECMDFITKCLMKDPNHRLGSKSKISEVMNHQWIRNVVYNIKGDLFRYYPFEKFLPQSPMIGTKGEDLNFLDEWFHEEDHQKSTGVNKFFDFSFRKSVDEIEEYATLSNTEPGKPDADQNTQALPAYSTGNKLKMASNLTKLNLK